jgi:hypothetical protein
LRSLDRQHLNQLLLLSSYDNKDDTKLLVRKKK